MTDVPVARDKFLVHTQRVSLGTWNSTHLSIKSAESFCASATVGTGAVSLQSFPG